MTSAHTALAAAQLSFAASTPVTLASPVFALPADQAPFEGALVIAEVSEDQARALYAKYDALVHAATERSQIIQEVVAYARGLGLTRAGRFNTDWVQRFLRPVDPVSSAMDGVSSMGYLTLKGSPYFQAIFVGGQVVFEANWGQRVFQDGAVFVQCEDDVQAFDPTAFVQNFRLGIGEEVHDVVSQIAHFAGPKVKPKRRSMKRPGRGLKAQLIMVPEIELKDKKLWVEFKRVNTGFYDGDVPIFAERWARFIQMEMAKGKRLEDVAESMRRKAGGQDLTGLQFFFALSVLVKTWKYGKQLRLWWDRTG